VSEIRVQTYTDCKDKFQATLELLEVYLKNCLTVA